MPRWFSRFARWTAKAAGSPTAFVVAVAAILLWAILGPAFDYSDSWMLWVNTGTTIVTFWLVFLIQGAQNRTEESLHRKLDELVKAVPQARDEVAGCEQREP